MNIEKRKKKEKSKFQIDFEYHAFMLIVKLIRSMSLKTAYRFANILSYLIYKLDFKHSRRSVRHILHSGIRTDMKEARKLARENFRHILKVFIEITKFNQIVTEENFHEHFGIADNPTAQRMMNPETSPQIILTTAHIGNWEIAGGTHSKKSGIPMCSIMRPLSNDRIGEYFYKNRSSFSHRTVSKEKGLRPLIAANKNGENITIVADQHASKKEGVDVLFFGHPARAHATPALLHLKTGTPIAMPYLIRVDDDFHFEFHCPEPIQYTPTGNKEEDVRNIVQLYTTMLENEIRRFPEQWLWPHRRWLDCGRGNDSYKIGNLECQENRKEKKDETSAE